jgi:DNA-binding LacI/PurR family transcriptional regulator
VPDPESVSPAEPVSPATILDVARLAGVSRTTVSRVLNYPDRVSEDTLRRVRKAADELRYIPSTAARSLRSGRSGTIALLSGDIAQPFHGGLAKAVALSAEARAMSLVLSDLDRSGRRLVEQLSRLPRQGIDGIIIATEVGFAPPAARAALREAIELGIPMVVTVGEHDMPELVTLHANFEAIARLAADRLIGRGCRAFALLVGIEEGYHSRQLRLGFAAASGSEPVVLDGKYKFAEAEHAVLEHLDAGKPLDGLVVATLPMALGAAQAIESRGLRVPDDVAIVVCEDVPLAGFVRPGITSVGVEATDYGEQLVQALDDAIRGVRSVQEPLEPRLIARASA